MELRGTVCIDRQSRKSFLSADVWRKEIWYRSLTSLPLCRDGSSPQVSIERLMFNTSSPHKATNRPRRWFTRSTGKTNRQAEEDEMPGRRKFWETRQVLEARGRRLPEGDISPVNQRWLERSLDYQFCSSHLSVYRGGDLILASSVGRCLASRIDSYHCL